MARVPCKGCEERKVGCRSECAGWAAFTAAKAEEQARRERETRAGREADALLCSARAKTNAYWLRKRGSWRQKPKPR